METLEEEIKTIVVNQLGIDKADVTLSKSFVEDLNADSLDVTELMMTLEERYGLEIPENGDSLKTVGDVVEYVRLKQQTPDNSN